MSCLPPTYQNSLRIKDKLIDASKIICICGGNEIATAAALKLFSSGYNVLLLVHPDENLLRYHLCLGDAIHQGQKTVENVLSLIHI